MRDRLYALTLLRGPRDVLTLAEVCAFASVVPLITRLSMPRLGAVLVRTPPTKQPDSREIERLERVVTLAPRVAHPLVRSGCLTRGLTLFWFLRRAGLNVQLCFGLDPDTTQEADGHCWLTLDAEPYLESRDPRTRFVELYRLPYAMT